MSAAGVSAEDPKRARFARDDDADPADDVVLEEQRGVVEAPIRLAGRRRPPVSASAERSPLASLRARRPSRVRPCPAASQLRREESVTRRPAGVRAPCSTSTDQVVATQGDRLVHQPLQVATVQRLLPEVGYDRLLAGASVECPRFLSAAARRPPSAPWGARFPRWLSRPSSRHCAYPEPQSQPPSKMTPDHTHYPRLTIPYVCSFDTRKRRGCEGERVLTREGGCNCGQAAASGPGGLGRAPPGPLGD